MHKVTNAGCYDYLNELLQLGSYHYYNESLCTLDLVSIVDTVSFYSGYSGFLPSLVYFVMVIRVSCYHDCSELVLIIRVLCDNHYSKFSWSFEYFIVVKVDCYSGLL